MNSPQPPLFNKEGVPSSPQPSLCNEERIPHFPQFPQHLRVRGWWVVVILLFLSQVGVRAGEGKGSSSLVESPVTLMDQALEALLDKNYEMAATLFERVHQLDPSNMAAKNGLMSAEAHLVRSEKKQRDLLKPRFKEVKRLLKEKRWVDAADLLSELKTKDPTHPDLLPLQKKLIDQVTNQRRQARPDTSDWFEADADLAYVNGDYFLAAASWGQVFAFDKNRLEIANRAERARGRLVEQQRLDRYRLFQADAFSQLNGGNYAEAIESWGKVLAVVPKDAQALEGIAQAEKALAEERQRKIAEKARQKTVEALEAYTSGRLSLARSLWAEVLRLDPGNELAQEYLKASEPERAAVAAPVLPRAPEDTPERALFLVRQKRYTEALEVLDRFLVIHPEAVEARQSREDTRRFQAELADASYRSGLERYAAGDTTEAIQQWQEALRIDPQFQRARQALIKAQASKSTRKGVPDEKKPQ